MKEIKIKFKITSSRILKCYNCSQLLGGKQGFISIKREASRFPDWNFSCVLCLDCWNKINKDIENDKGNKDNEEYFNLLVKKSMINKLKWIK